MNTRKVAGKTEWQGRILAAENRRLEQQKNGNGAPNRTTAGSWPLCSPSTRRLNQTAICALELLRIGARKESKKKTVVRHVSRERNSAEVKSKTKLEVFLLEIKWAEDSLLYTRNQICWLGAQSRTL
jgi:hypothetical protein